MVLDYPDWSRVSSGSLRYLGTITAPPGGQTTASYPVQPSERSIVFMPVIISIAGAWAQAVGNASGYTSPVCYWGVAGGVDSLTPASIVVSALVDPSYTVTVTTLAAGFPSTVAVFASTDPPTVSNPGTPTAVVFTDGQSLLIGQQAQVKSLPVVPTSDLPIGNAGLKPSSQSMPVVVTDSQAAGMTGQQVSASSLPVVLPSDWPGAPTSWHKPYDSILFSGPAAATKATVTFPATVGRRWVLDYAVWGVATGATAAATNADGVVIDGVTTIFDIPVSFPSGAQANDTKIMGPGWGIVGSVGASLTVAFALAGPASTFQKVSAGAYLLPVGL